MHKGGTDPRGSHAEIQMHLWAGFATWKLPMTERARWGPRYKANSFALFGVR